jgi:hypothetical protein
MVPFAVGRELNDVQQLQIGRIEWFREQIAHLKGLGFALQIRENYRDIAAEFPDDLPAGTARRREGIRVGHDGDGVEPAFALADCFEDRSAFGADRQAVTGIFDVAPAEDSSRNSSKRGADAEIRVGSMRILARLPRIRDQVFILRHTTIPSQSKAFR